MIKVWIAGSNGQIGHALNEVLDPLEIEVLNTDKDELDITDTEEVLNFGIVNRPDVIINCTGVTDTKLCEEEPELAYRVNALGARNLSIVARKNGAKMVQLSTDDVFDGKSKKPYTEFDDTNPMTVYGASKRAGENYVKEFTHKHFIIRSNWVYGKYGHNFVNQVLEAAEKGNTLSVAADQFGSPTSAKDLARMEGIMCGISSGTNVAAALKLAKKLGKGKTVVTVLPDTAERYFSTPLFENE